MDAIKILSLRINEDLLREIEALAKRDLRSINSEILYLLRLYVAREGE